MIPITRGSEPDALREQRETRLPPVIEMWREAGSVTAELKNALTGYQAGGAVKEKLFKGQHKKCAYCERKPGFEGQPIEHFRPKKEAWRNLPAEPPVVDEERYWWLTWSWENLLFACQTCNGRARKANYFPLEVSSRPLPLLSTEIRREHPLLLDPTEPDLRVSDHLVWAPVDRVVVIGRWSWELKARSPRGQATKDILGLKDRTDDVTGHYRVTVWKRYEAEVDVQLRVGRVEEAHRAFDRLRRELLAADRELVFATWSMLDVLRTHHRRARDARLQLDPI
jgi:hypothetical protein